jgi:hypothetical protein
MMVVNIDFNCGLSRAGFTAQNAPKRKQKKATTDYRITRMGMGREMRREI